MKLGLYNAIFHDRSLPEALQAIRDAGLTGIELNTGGFLPAKHIPTGQVRRSGVSAFR